MTAVNIQFNINVVVALKITGLDKNTYDQHNIFVY